MSHIVKIGGIDVHLAWTQASARELRTRASKLGEDVTDLWRGLANNKRADYCAAALLWMLVPDDIYDAHATPEKLWRKVADEDIEDALKAIVGTLSDSSPTAEKKSTSKRSPSQKSN